MSNREESEGVMKTVSGMDLLQVLQTIRNETQPINGHTDSGALQDCWKEVLETIEGQQKKTFSLNQLAEQVHQNAVDHGWWKEDRHFGSLIALMHSELSEALEEYRNGHKPNETYFSCKSHGCIENENEIFPCKNPAICGTGKPQGIPIELADCIIRILDYCGKEKINMEEAIRLKHEYNKTRPYRHGGKAI